MQLGLTRIVSSFLGPNCSQSPSGVGSTPSPPQLLPEPLKLWVRDILFDMARRKQTQTCNLGVGLMPPPVTLKLGRELEAMFRTTC